MGLGTRMCVSLLMKVLNLGRSYKFRNRGLFKKHYMCLIQCLMMNRIQDYNYGPIVIKYMYA